MENKQAVVVFTNHRGVFFGYTDNPDDDIVVLTNARQAFQWGTTRGVLELAECGPGELAKIGARAPEPRLRDVTAVMSCSPEAVQAWEGASWHR